MSLSLTVIQTHPIQYHAPIYRVLQQQLGVPVTVLYGSDFSVVGYRDAEFGATFAWDTDLLSGYDARFLARVAEGGPPSVEHVTGKGIEQALAETDAAAVLLTGYAGPFHRRAFRAARRLGLSILFRAETTDEARTRHPLKQWARDAYLRWFYRQCAVLLPIGQRSASHYRRLAPRRPRVLSPYCVDIAPFQTEDADRARLREPARSQLALSADQLVLLFVGKLIPKKAPDLLLRAAKALPPWLRERIVVAFLGDGELRPTLQALAETEPKVQTRFLGFQNQRHLSPFYHAAELMVLPSAWGETWGLVVNEALHHGVPCVVSNRVGAAPDLVIPGETGECFETGSVSSLQEALVRATKLAGDKSVRDTCRCVVSAYSVVHAAQGIATALQMSVSQRLAVPTQNSH